MRKPALGAEDSGEETDDAAISAAAGAAMVSQG